MLKTNFKMKTKLLSSFALLALLSFNPNIINAQNIFDKAAQNNDPGIIKYTEYKLASSNGYAYLLDGYKTQTLSKVVFMLNAKDNKVDECVKKALQKIGIEAANLLDLKCIECTTGEKMKTYLKEKGYDCLLQITLDIDKRTANFLTTNYYELYGNMVSSYTVFGTLNSVNAVLEWYNFENDKMPFLKSWMYKESSHGLGDRMYNIIDGSITAQILRVAEKGLLGNKKEMKK